MVFKCLLRGIKEVPFQRYSVGKVRFSPRNLKGFFRRGSDGSGVEEDLETIWQFPAGVSLAWLPNPQS